jgi:branched-chain amino acid transport system substrate-binding protein
MKRWIVLAALGILALGVPVSAPAQAQTASGDFYDIPVINALTGGGAFLGMEEHDALQLVERLANKTGGIHGKPVRFVFHDDQSSPQIGVQLLNDAIATHPTIIMGSSLVGTCNAMSPLVQDNGPVMYCFSAGIHPAAGSYIFVAGVSTHDQAIALVRYFRLKGWSKLATITSTDATGQDADKGFDDLLALPENKDLKLVARAHFNPADVSAAAQLEQITAAKPQAVVAWSTGSPVATAFRGIVQAGYAGPVGTTGGNMTYAQMHRFAEFLPKELYLPSPEWPVNGDARIKLDPKVAQKQKELYAAYAEIGAKPDEGSLLGWDPAIIVIDALRALPAGASAAQLRDYLLHLKGQAGANGIYNYEASPQRGLSLDNVLVTRWDAAADQWHVVAQPGGAPVK